jgi:hypothetical protein
MSYHMHYEISLTLDSRIIFLSSIVDFGNSDDWFAV